MKSKKSISQILGPLAIPLIAIGILVVFNLIRDPEFFSIVIKHNNDGNAVLSGNLITIINGASELAISHRRKYVRKDPEVCRVHYRRNRCSCIYLRMPDRHGIWRI